MTPESTPRFSAIAGWRSSLVRSGILNDPAADATSSQDRFQDTVAELRVSLRDEQGEEDERTSKGRRLRSPAERAELVQAIALYRSRGFDYLGVDECDEETLAPPADELVKKLVHHRATPLGVVAVFEMVSAEL
jgi:hypothetical protein